MKIFEALDECSSVSNPIYRCTDDLLDFLYHTGEYTDSASTTLSNILLGLNLPGADGLRGARLRGELKIISSCGILTSSKRISRFITGMESMIYIVKPIDIKKIIESNPGFFIDYWFESVILTMQQS